METFLVLKSVRYPQVTTIKLKINMTVLNPLKTKLV
jgi:hypothetical protein